MAYYAHENSALFTETNNIHQLFLNTQNVEKSLYLIYKLEHGIITTQHNQNKQYL